jgi:hypothetical protein
MEGYEFVYKLYIKQAELGARVVYIISEKLVCI